MTVGHVLIFIYALAIVLFAVWAWKLWHGEWLNSISGNTFATEDELKLPYQKRMGKDVAVLMAMCILLFAVLIYNEAIGMERTTLLIAAAGFFVALVVGSVFVTVRANKAAKEEQEKARLPERGFPMKETDPDFGGGKKLVVVQWIFVGIAAMLPTIVTFVAYFLGWID